MDDLLAILNDLYPDVDFATYDANADGPLIQSMELVELINAIEERFGVEFPPSLMGNPEHFHSAQAIWSLIERLEDE
jgi:acyl carrier protein